ncbi:hypothetical protein HDF24_04760 [Mucilaginibacter sp. X4EP1]|uniref:hypothetical protein n=1 Tax=Mucilaginibacter sp. X4EP1 TaxID=2723092 RepID=UPI0021696282|nr:hypothetical protein [Mucilaginibacter sp. X4EP1]MCS3816514.1 F0F1-type ATP synthase assembly protein I [Mucilaginibacter sp. X4EP1]
MEKYQFSEPLEHGIFAYSKEAQDSQSYKDLIKQRDEDVKREYEENRYRERQEEERQEKEADRKSDRRFLWVVTLVSAIVGAVIGSIVTIIYEFF